jgi:hypothetical protein
MLKFIIKFFWPLIFKIRKYIYPIKLKIYQSKFYDKYNQSYCSDYFCGLILMFDQNFSKGGFVDRLKGIVSAYYLSKELNIDFRIYFSIEKDPLINVINQSVIQLITNSKDICYSKKVSIPVIWYNYLPPKSKSLLIKLRYRKQFHLYTNMNVLTNYFTNSDDAVKCWSSIFKNVFTFSINYFILPESSRNYRKKIGIHLRFTGMLDDFSDISFHNISLIEKDLMIEWCFKNVISLTNKYEDAFISIVSDSKNFLNILQNSFELNRIRNRVFIEFDYIGHTAIDASGDVFLKTVCDFITLSECDKVYQLRYGKMHKSDFSKYACMVNLKEFELFEKV